MAMSTQQSHGYARSYFGEFETVPLLQWLNRKDRPTDDPVEKLIRVSREYGGVRAVISGNDPAAKIEKIVSETVRKYKVGVAPVVDVVTLSSWDVKWQLVGRMDPSQGLALIRLLHAASRGLVDRIRQCAWVQCRKWFFARFSHQECCSVRCQQQRVRSTEEWKKKKREYMRSLRAENRQREKRQLELSRTRKGSKR
jgi:hypothetical protein